MLLLLFADRRGDLRVVLTVRSAMLKSFAGQVAFPGGELLLPPAPPPLTPLGKADTPTETPAQTARREAFEEIGLPLDTPRSPFHIEHLTELPLSMAVTNLVVRPCVALLQDDEGALMPRLDPKEVQSVFTVPLERFLGVRYGGFEGGGDPEERDGVGWYAGRWMPWGKMKWK